MVLEEMILRDSGRFMMCVVEGVVGIWSGCVCVCVCVLEFGYECLGEDSQGSISRTFLNPT